jgi:energy-coupling factor transporter ATP-binding protein EcfA2
MTTRASLQDVRRFLSLLARPGDVFELRALSRVRGQQHVDFGFFDDFEQMATVAANVSGKHDGIYITLNPANPALLARAPKNQLRRAGNGDTTSDRDVAMRRSILVDIDPVRPTGISSTDEEHDAALNLADKIRRDLVDAGWPSPIFADSGNGAHLIFGVDLPVDDGGLVMRALKRLSKTYSTPTLKVDEKVFNPARISKMYGTLTRKGEDTPERPHRIARIMAAPAELELVPRAVLEAFAPAETRTPRNEERRGPSTYNAERATFNADDFIAQHLPDAKERSWASGRKWILPVCPFNDSHDRGEAHVEQLHSGAMSAGCLHESCKWAWKDLRKKFDPDAYAYEERRANGNGHISNRTTDREPPPEVLYEDEGYAYAQQQAEYDRIAAQDAEETPEQQKPYRRAPSLVSAIMERANDPWIELSPGGGDVFANVRVGATVVVIGGSGSGKSSLTSCMLVEHAKNVGPAIALSIELPAEELAARIVGIKCDASWEDALRGRVQHDDMARALDLPRLWVLDRRRATIKNLETAVKDARAEFPGQPILVAIDYTQLLDSREREARMRVADAFAQIDDCAREHKFVALALSQMSRASAKIARKGEAIGAESADLGAETAAIERFATLTLTIGMATEREDGSSAVELSVGKARMGKGDRVIPMTYWGRSGLWRVAGEAKTASEVRDQREAEKETKARSTAELAMLSAARASIAPVTRQQLMDAITGRKATKVTALGALIARGDLIEVNKKQPKTKYWFVWTPDRARDAGVEPRQSMSQIGDGQ